MVDIWSLYKAVYLCGGGVYYALNVIKNGYFQLSLSDEVQDHPKIVVYISLCGSHRRDLTTLFLYVLEEIVDNC